MRYEPPSNASSRWGGATTVRSGAAAGTVPQVRRSGGAERAIGAASQTRRPRFHAPPAAALCPSVPFATLGGTTFFGLRRLDGKVGGLGDVEMRYNHYAGSAWNPRRKVAWLVAAVPSPAPPAVTRPSETAGWPRRGGLAPPPGHPAPVRDCRRAP